MAPWVSLESKEFQVSLESKVQSVPRVFKEHKVQPALPVLLDPRARKGNRDPQEPRDRPDYQALKVPPALRGFRVPLVLPVPLELQEFKERRVRSGPPELLARPGLLEQPGRPVLRDLSVPRVRWALQEFEELPVHRSSLRFRKP